MSGGSGGQQRCEFASAIVSLIIFADKTLPDEPATKMPTRMMDKSKDINKSSGCFRSIFQTLANH